MLIEFENDNSSVSLKLDNVFITIYKAPKDHVASFTRSEIIMSEEVMELPDGVYAGVSKEIDGLIFSSVIGRDIYCRISEIPEEYNECAFLKQVAPDVSCIRYLNYTIFTKFQGSYYNVKAYNMDTEEVFVRSGELT